MDPLKEKPKVSDLNRPLEDQKTNYYIDLVSQAIEWVGSWFYQKSTATEKYPKDVIGLLRQELDERHLKVQGIASEILGGVDKAYSKLAEEYLNESLNQFKEEKNRLDLCKGKEVSQDFVLQALGDVGQFLNRVDEKTSSTDHLRRDILGLVRNKINQKFLMIKNELESVYKEKFGESQKISSDEIKFFESAVSLMRDCDRIQKAEDQVEALSDLLILYEGLSALADKKIIKIKNMESESEKSIPSKLSKEQFRLHLFFRFGLVPKLEVMGPNAFFEAALIHDFSDEPVTDYQIARLRQDLGYYLKEHRFNQVRYYMQSICNQLKECQKISEAYHCIEHLPKQLQNKFLVLWSKKQSNPDEFDESLQEFMMESVELYTSHFQFSLCPLGEIELNALSEMKDISIHVFEPNKKMIQFGNGSNCIRLLKQEEKRYQILALEDLPQ